jgi:ABC-2 type transport system permease protein
MRAKHYLLELLSGLLLPITFFPDWMATLSQWLPFQAIAFLPSSIYLGRLQGSALGQALLTQVFWVVALALLCTWTWRRAARRLTVQGG